MSISEFHYTLGPNTCRICIDLFGCLVYSPKTFFFCHFCMRGRGISTFLPAQFPSFPMVWGRGPFSVLQSSMYSIQLFDFCIPIYVSCTISICILYIIIYFHHKDLGLVRLNYGFQVPRGHWWGNGGIGLPDPGWETPLDFRVELERQGFHLVQRHRIHLFPFLIYVVWMWNVILGKPP